MVGAWQRWASDQAYLQRVQRWTAPDKTLGLPQVRKDCYCTGNATRDVATVIFLSWAAIVAMRNSSSLAIQSTLSVRLLADVLTLEYIDILIPGYGLILGLVCRGAVFCLIAINILFCFGFAALRYLDQVNKAPPGLCSYRSDNNSYPTTTGLWS